jgi:hypothetical protein
LKKRVLRTLFFFVNMAPNRGFRTSFTSICSAPKVAPRGLAPLDRLTRVSASIPKIIHFTCNQPAHYTSVASNSKRSRSAKSARRFLLPAAHTAAFRLRDWSPEKVKGFW